MRKLFLKFTFGLLVLVSIMLLSCQEDGFFSGNKSSENYKYLFNTIVLQTESPGVFMFAESKSIVGEQSRYLLTEKNKILNTVDEFGLEFTELGTQYFYAVDYSEDGTTLFFTFLNEENSALFSEI